jgi:hypothetical protein
MCSLIGSEELKNKQKQRFWRPTVGSYKLVVGLRFPHQSEQRSEFFISNLFFSITPWFTTVWTRTSLFKMRVSHQHRIYPRIPLKRLKSDV